jgi:hypothetical protein
VERTTWTAAAVVLAADALSGATPAAGLFTDPAALPAAGMAEDHDSRNHEAAGWRPGSAGTVLP